ncbi:hypothetical protein PBY51_012297 [Eleginops maclovinus]|uniref:Uncharacterized protein n=1 Tax=Eleginops maclovinus TaxID=56733 RepID=A0AAN8ATA1_ELEMC|nr:hypothetical protein PBY51_012297 [Eleginops maclovinus]
MLFVVEMGTAVEAEEMGTSAETVVMGTAVEAEEMAASPQRLFRISSRNSVYSSAASNASLGVSHPFSCISNTDRSKTSSSQGN